MGISKTSRQRSTVYLTCKRNQAPRQKQTNKNVIKVKILMWVKILLINNNLPEQTVLMDFA